MLRAPETVLMYLDQGLGGLRKSESAPRVLEVSRSLREDASRGPACATPVFLPSGRKSEKDAAWASPSRRFKSRTPFALVQHFVPGREGESLQAQHRPNWVRLLGAFESATAAKRLVRALTCSARAGGASGGRRRWSRFHGWETLNLAVSIHFVLLCEGAVCEAVSFEHRELPGMGGPEAPAYPAGCRCPEQAFAVVSARAWWQASTDDLRLRSRSSSQGAPSFSEVLRRAQLEMLSELSAVGEVFGAFATEQRARDKALELLEGDDDTSVSTARARDASRRTPSPLVAVLPMYRWIELGAATAAQIASCATELRTAVAERDADEAARRHFRSCTQLRHVDQQPQPSPVPRGTAPAHRPATTTGLLLEPLSASSASPRAAADDDSDRRRQRQHPQHPHQRRGGDPHAATHASAREFIAAVARMRQGAAPPAKGKRSAPPVGPALAKPPNDDRKLLEERLGKLMGQVAATHKSLQTIRDMPNLSSAARGQVFS